MIALKGESTIAISPYQIRKYLDMGYTICDNHAVALQDPESYIPTPNSSDNVQVIASMPDGTVKIPITRTGGSSK